MSIFNGTVGKEYGGRFVIPEEVDKRKVSLFSIIDLNEVRARTGDSDIHWRAQGFGVTWIERVHKVLQVFGYRVATTAEMKIMDKRRGEFGRDFFYVVYKAPLKSDTIHFLPDSQSKAGIEILGGARHDSQYGVPANEEAMAVTYHIARRFGIQTSQKLGLEFAEFIPEKDIVDAIETQTSQHGADKITLFDLSVQSKLSPRKTVSSIS